MFSFNSIKGKWTGKWEMLYIFIGTDLWLIYIFQGWEMGNVPIPGFYIYIGVHGLTHFPLQPR